jgi:WD40-like Beta Propeller Repeat
VSELSEGAGALTAALIVDGARAAGPMISPDGHWVAWTTSSAGGPGPQVSELWLAPVAETAAPVTETAAPVRLAGGNVRLPRWSPDSGWLFYAADEELRRLQITADGPAGDAEAVLRWRGEISGLTPLVGGRLVAVVAGDELTDRDERRRAGHDDAMAWSERALRQHWLWHRLRLLDLASGELSVIAGLAGRHIVDMTQRPDGGPLAVVS